VDFPLAPSGRGGEVPVGAHGSAKYAIVVLAKADDFSAA
jgi:hypothetical protein